jgi:hypothetical protein
MGEQIGLSASETHAAFRRARQSGLIHPEQPSPVKSALAEFLLHGLKYIYPVKPGHRTRGTPTSFAASPLAAEFASSSSSENVPVWPDPEGTQSGYEFKPLYQSVPLAAKRDARLYEWLVLVDAIRGGRARERELAARMIAKRLGYGKPY